MTYRIYPLCSDGSAQLLLSALLMLKEWHHLEFRERESETGMLQMSCCTLCSKNIQAGSSLISTLILIRHLAFSTVFVWRGRAKLVVTLADLKLPCMTAPPEDVTEFISSYHTNLDTLLVQHNSTLPLSPLVSQRLLAILKNNKILFLGCGLDLIDYMAGDARHPSQRLCS